MPVYEYRCDDCRELTEALRRMADADDPQPCEHCGGETTQRVHSVFAAGASEADAGFEACPPGGCGMM